jgi:hypothetical protein
MDDIMPPLLKIENVIADDFWSYRLQDGTERISRVTVGRPEPIPGDPGGSWYCPFFFEHFTDGIDWAGGVGPVDALANAMRFVSARFDELDRVSPRARPAV